MEKHSSTISIRLHEDEKQMFLAKIHAMKIAGRGRYNPTASWYAANLIREDLGLQNKQELQGTQGKRKGAA